MPCPRSVVIAEKLSRPSLNGCGLIWRMTWDTLRMDIPDVHYARSGGIAIAYQVIGDAQETLVFGPPLRGSSASSRRVLTCPRGASATWAARGGPT